MRMRAALHHSQRERGGVGGENKPPEIAIIQPEIKRAKTHLWVIMGHCVLTSMCCKSTSTQGGAVLQFLAGDLNQEGTNH